MNSMSEHGREMAQKVKQATMGYTADTLVMVKWVYS